MNLLTEWLTSKVLGGVRIVVKQGISVSALDPEETEAEGRVLAVAAEVVGMGVVIEIGVAVLGMLLIAMLPRQM
jgi:hypothetical protein